MNSFSGYSEFQKITNIILLNNGNVDWDALEKTSLSSLFSRMARTYQNPKFHGEYMSQYTWAEETCGLLWRSEK